MICLLDSVEQWHKLKASVRVLISGIQRNQYNSDHIYVYTIIIYSKHYSYNINTLMTPVMTIT